MFPQSPIKIVSPSSLAMGARDSIALSLSLSLGIALGSRMRVRSRPARCLVRLAVKRRRDDLRAGGALSAHKAVPRRNRRAAFLGQDASSPRNCENFVREHEIATTCPGLLGCLACLLHAPLSHIDSQRRSHRHATWNCVANALRMCCKSPAAFINHLADAQKVRFCERLLLTHTCISDTHAYHETLFHR